MLFCLLILALAGSVRQDFVCDNWPRVAGAAELLEVNEGIPVLLEIMAQDLEVPLKETEDLIYPGASRYYGHGRKIDYELNWLAGRAGWVLEDLTFESFGFRQSDISEADVRQAASFDPSLRGRPLTDLLGDPRVRASLRRRAVERASDWWKQQGGRFDRQTAALAALAANQDPGVQLRVLHALRDGRLPLRPYKEAVERLRHGLDDEVRKQADLLFPEGR